MKTNDVLSIGSVYLDVYCLDFPFDEGLKTETQIVGEKYNISPGGSIIIFSSVAASLGIKPIIVGKVGDDYIGQIIKAELNEKNIQTSFITSSKHHTNMSMNFINNKGKNILTTVGNANQSLEVDEVKEKFFSNIDKVSFLYLGGVYKFKLLQNYYLEMIDLAKKKGVKIILDHGRVTNAVSKSQMDLIKKILPSIDFYVPNKSEFLSTFGASNVKEGLEEIKRLTQKTKVIVTDAENEAVGMDTNHEIFTCQSNKIKPINTVGAGDSFNAGFLRAQIDGKSLHESVEFAHRVAAFKISKNRYPTKSEI